MNDNFLNALLLLIGLFSMISAITNWAWFFNSRRAQGMVKLIGKMGARIFYFILGLVIAGVGVLSFMGVI